MANKKITALTALTAPAASDVLPIIDLSEASTADQNKKITYEDLFTGVPDGSTSLPSIAFQLDQDTGIARNGDNGIQFVTGGTARLTISSAGLVTIPGDLTVSGTNTVVDTTTLTVKDKNIEIAKGNGDDSAVDGAGITIDSTDGDKTWNWVNSTDAWTSSEHIDLASGKVLKVAGTQVLSATNYTGTAATATTATNVTLAAESTDTSCSILFATAASGNLPPKTATSLTFNSNTGALTATSFVGNLTGNVTGNTSGSAGSCTGNAATATALATARAINGVDFDGTGAITVTAAAGTLTGTELKSTVVTSSLTSVGTLSSLASGAITTTGHLSVDNDKEVRFYEADSNGSAYVGIKGATDKGSEASYTVSLPADAPTANQILKADASTPTTLTWATDSGGIPDTGGTFTGKVTHNYTSSIRVPVGTTAQRDGSPSNGDFRYNSTTSKFEGYNSGWGEIGGGATGSADLLDIASSSGTGGGGSTFDGSRYRFKLVTKGTSDAVTPVNAEILRVSIAGVMQQPNDGTGQGDMTEGYVVSGTDIIFDSAPPSGASYFIINMGTQIAVGNATSFTVADESSDTTCFPLFVTAATGDLAPKSGSNLAFNSATGQLTATSYAGDGSALTGLASSVADGCIYENSQTISSTYTMSTNKNGHSVGPITVSGTVTIPTGSNWVIS